MCNARDRRLCESRTVSEVVEGLVRDLLKQVGDMREDIGALSAKADTGQSDREGMKDEQRNTQVAIGAVLERLSTIDEKLANGAETFKAQNETLDMLDRRTDITETKIVSIDASLNPPDEKSLLQRVKTLEAFHGKVGAIIAVASLILSGATLLIAAGFKWLFGHWSDVGAWLSSLFHR